MFSAVRAVFHTPKSLGGRCLPINRPSCYPWDMGLCATTEVDLLRRSVSTEADPRSKNRILSFSTVSYSCTGENQPQAAQPHQEIHSMGTSVSGVFCWLSNDPIDIAGGLNQYAFCRNNPVNFVDPFGLQDCHSWADTRAILLKYRQQWVQRWWDPSHIQSVVGNFDYKLKNPPDIFMVPGLGALQGNQFGNFAAGWVATSIYGPQLGLAGTYTYGHIYAFGDWLAGMSSLPFDDPGSQSMITLGAIYATLDFRMSKITMDCDPVTTGCK